MISAPRLAHLVLQTNQLPEMRAWYQRVLGARIAFENQVMCFLTTDEEHHRIALFGPPGGGLPERTPVTVGLAHSAFTFECLGDLVDKYLELKELGIEPRVPVQHGVTTSLYYRDPDGNMVELQIDNFETADEATKYMKGAEYTKDSIGPSFDADNLVAAFRSGTTQEELTSRTWAKKSDQVNVMALLTT